MLSAATIFLTEKPSDLLMGIDRESTADQAGIYTTVLFSAFQQVSFQPVLHDWCNKGRGMYYPVCGMVHIKEPLLLSIRVAYVAATGFLSHYQNGP